MKSIIQGLSKQAEQIGVPFHVIGLAAETDPEAGLKYLSTIAKFDEIAVGGHWANTAALRYVWEGHQGSGAVPQVVVLARVLRTPDPTVGAAVVSARSEVLLARKIGQFELERWAEAGARLPSGIARFF